MKTQAFRETRRGSVPKYYSGWVHLATIMGSSLAAAGITAFFISNLVWLELLIIPLTVVIANLVEYSIHRFPMHKLFKGSNFLTKIYKNHSGNHHRYFTDKEMSIDCKEDMREVFTYPRVILFFIVFIIGPLSLLFGLLLSLNSGLLFFATALAYYAIYEFTHFATHLPEDHWISKLPYIRGAKERHRLHHNTRLMREWNFNVSFPLMDKLFKTIKN